MVSRKKRDEDGEMRSLNPFDNDRGCHAAGGAHGHESTLQVASLQFVKKGTDEDRAGGTDRVAKRDRAATFTLSRSS